MMKYLQKLGKALMLPVACLPICGILMGIGYALCPSTMQGGDVTGIVQMIGFFLVKAGGALIDNMAILFVIGVGVGMADDNDGTAGLAALAWGALYDAKIFKELRFPCGRHYEDEYVFVSVFENQECVVCIPENIYYYLQRADSIMGVTYKKQDCMDYFEMWHERIDYFQAKEDRELLAPVIQSCLAWNVLYLAMNGEAMEEPEKRLLKKDIRKYFWKIFAKPYLYNWKESVKLAVKCVMVLMNDKSLGKRYV